MAARRECMWCGCSPRNSAARTTPRILTSARPASCSAGTPAIATPKRCSNAGPGSANSIRSRASFCMNRWRRWRRRRNNLSLAGEIDRRRDETRRVLLAAFFVAIVALLQGGHDHHFPAVDGLDMPNLLRVPARTFATAGEIGFGIDLVLVTGIGVGQPLDGLKRALRFVVTDGAAIDVHDARDRNVVLFF